MAYGEVPPSGLKRAHLVLFLLTKTASFTQPTIPDVLLSTFQHLQLVCHTAVFHRLLSHHPPWPDRAGGAKLIDVPAATLTR